jgi:hypothetical protein
LDFEELNELIIKQDPELIAILGKTIKGIIASVVKEEVSAQRKGLVSIGGKLNFEREEGLQGKLDDLILKKIFSLEQGAAYVPNPDVPSEVVVEYLLPPVQSGINLRDAIYGLHMFLNILPYGARIQLTLRQRFDDRIKYMGWALISLMSEKLYKIQVKETPIGKIGLACHGGGFMTFRPGEEKSSYEPKYDRIDLLFFNIEDGYGEWIEDAQYLGSMLANNPEEYERFMEALRDLYTRFSISKSEFRQYILGVTDEGRDRYEGQDEKMLLEKIGEIPWDGWSENGEVNLSWIFEAPWFVDTPHHDERYEASWDDQYMTAVLMEAIKIKYGDELKNAVEEILKLFLPEES